MTTPDLQLMDDYFKGAVSRALGQGVLNAPVRRGTFIGFCFWFLNQWAVTWNGEIHLTLSALVVSTEDYNRLLAHESYHVWQQQNMGWWPFLGEYIKGLAWGLLRGQNIRDHPLEQPAYDFVEGLKE